MPAPGKTGTTGCTCLSSPSSRSSFAACWGSNFTAIGGTRIVDVAITEFEDLRLKDVIDSARKRGSNIDVFRIELKVLEAEMLTAMLGVRRESYAREMAVLTQGLGEAETDAKIAAIRSDEEARLKSVRASYNGLNGAEALPDIRPGGSARERGEGAGEAGRRGPQLATPTACTSFT